jgi:hypothetical protein
MMADFRRMPEMGIDSHNGTAGRTGAAGDNSLNCPAIIGAFLHARSFVKKGRSLNNNLMI